MACALQTTLLRSLMLQLAAASAAATAAEIQQQQQQQRCLAAATAGYELNELLHMQKAAKVVSIFSLMRSYSCWSGLVLLQQH
jgi:hypothetical protein